MASPAPALPPALPPAARHADTRRVVCAADCARAHRLCLEVPEVSNGSRYILSATDRGYEMPTHQLSREPAKQRLPSGEASDATQSRAVQCELRVN